MRDTIKDKRYFDSYLEYQYSRVEKQIGKLTDCHESEKRQRILSSLTGFEVNLLKAEFSAGASLEKMRDLLRKAMDVIGEYENVTEENALVLLSLAVILGFRREDLPQMGSIEQLANSDRLLMLMYSWLVDGTVNWDGAKTLRAEYALLDDVFEYSDKENALKQYLKKWYGNHSDYSWYDSHLSKENVYCGYWSFEAAAIAKILKLDERYLERFKYYPRI